MRLEIASLLAILCFAALATAVPDSFVTGPYKISFDLGLNQSNYNVTIAPAKHTESLNGIEETDYEIKISDINISRPDNLSVLDNLAIQKLLLSGAFHGADIIIGEFKEAQQVATAEERSSYLESTEGADPNISGFEVATRKIDGTTGAVASEYVIFDSIPLETYHAMYNTAFDPSHVYVNIVSFYPWDEGTLQLLKTIRVTRQ